MVVFCTQTLHSSLPSSLPLVTLVSLVLLLLPAHCTVIFRLSLIYLPTIAISSHFVFLSFTLAVFLNCRQRGNLWPQLAVGRVGTLPFASPGQQPSHPWCSTMIHLYCLPPPQPCCSALGFHSFALHLSPRVSSGLPWASCCWQHPCLPHCHLTFYL